MDSAARHGRTVPTNRPSKTDVLTRAAFAGLVKYGEIYSRLSTRWLSSLNLKLWRGCRMTIS